MLDAILSGARPSVKNSCARRAFPRSVSAGGRILFLVFFGGEVILGKVFFRENFPAL